MLVDVHCHLHHCWFDKDRDEAVERAKDAGVKVIVNNGLNPSSNRKTLGLAKKYDVVKAALGIYPTEILTKELKAKGWNFEEIDVDSELGFIKKNKSRIVAIGEIGLDYYHFKGTLDVQEELFRKQLELAEKIKKPVIVHSRGAENQTVKILEDYKVTAVLHSFGSDDFRKAIDAGHYFSIPVTVIRNKHFQNLTSKVSMSRLLTETDSPYLGLRRGERNEPANVHHSIKKISEIKRITEMEAEKFIYNNFLEVFS